jgi:spore coat polysaccharide biosynthesis protein SpsF
MKTIAMIQARLKSSRFPGKVLEKIKDKTIIEVMVERLKKCQHIDKVVVVIPDNEPKLEAFFKDKDISYYPGSEKDVLKRFYDANKYYHGDHVVRLTADCPLIDPDIVDAVVSQHKTASSEFTTNSWIGKETFPDGLDVSVMTGQILARVHAEATEDKDREHVVTYVYDNPQRFKSCIVDAKENYPEMRLTVDYPEDLEVIKNICAEFHDLRFNTNDIIKLYHRKPEIFKINITNVRNESYIEQVEKKKPGRPKAK